jgi:hypothetical protein
MAEPMVWMEYPPTGVKHQFGERAAEAWQAKGWVACDPPEETEDPNLRDPAPPAEPVTEPAAEPAQSKKKVTRP